MSKRYPGGVIRKTPATPTQSSASGVWGMTDVTQAQQTNNWPVANVPNPMSRSLRFRQSASAYMNRTPAVAGNLTTWTYSVWVKRGAPPTNSGNYQSFMSYTPGGANEDLLSFGALNDEKLYFYIYKSGYVGQLVTTQYFRDPSAWYHLVFVWDTTQATASNRMKVYVNGVQVTAFATANYPSQNATSNINTAGLTYIGRYGNSNAYTDSYMSEANFVDGQALAATDFGQYDQFSNWTSKKYTGTYGTNGFYLPFSNNSSTGTLGLDFSGNNNTWTTNNFSLTAGTTYDSMTDVPTQWTPYNVTGDVGGIIRGNYCVLNPLNVGTGTISDGNLKWVVSASTGYLCLGTMAFDIASTTNQYYWEFTLTSGQCTFGIAPSTAVGSDTSRIGSYSYYNANGNKYSGVSASAYGASFTSGDVIGVAVGSGAITFYKNGTSQGAAFTGLTGYFIPMIAEVTVTATANFGQYPFTYAPPSGYKSLCTTNLPTPTIQQGNLVMDATTYTGSASYPINVVNAGGFKPDLVWNKIRNSAGDHFLVDSVRGASKYLTSDTTNAEGTAANFLTAFNSNGFSMGSSSYGASDTVVGWQWQAGQGSTSTNNDGNRTSTVSVNASAGFSVVTYTFTSSGTNTIGHGLGVAPAMIIMKDRTDVYNWDVYHQSVGYTKRLILNTTSAQVNGFWQAAPTSSVFSVTSGCYSNNDNVVAYCWAEIAGFSKFGSYTGNGSADGTFVYTGFRPKFFLWKDASDAGTSWGIIDTSRDTYNVSGKELFPNNSNSEASYTIADILSNGIKMRNTFSDTNGSGSTYIYMAFAEYPFKSALAR
jgi:hypothetical protein